MSVIVPETNGASHLLTVLILISDASLVPVLESKASAFITETAVVLGAKDNGA